MDPSASCHYTLFGSSRTQSTIERREGGEREMCKKDAQILSLLFLLCYVFLVSFSSCIVRFNEQTCWKQLNIPLSTMIFYFVNITVRIALENNRTMVLILLENLKFVIVFLVSLFQGKKHIGTININIDICYYIERKIILMHGSFKYYSILGACLVGT